MNSGMISVRYARALYNYASEKQADKVVFDEMKQLASVYNHLPDFKSAIDNPVMSASNKLKLIIQTVNTDVSNVSERFIQLVLDRKRETHLYRIALAYQDLYRKENNVTVGRLIMADSFDSSVIDKIKKLVQKSHPGDVEFETETNPEIGGGFVLYVDTYRLDASVATQLKNIKKQLLNGNKRIA